MLAGKYSINLIKLNPFNISSISTIIMHYVYSEIDKSYKSGITILSNLFLHLNPRCMQMRMYLKIEIGIDLVYNRCIEKICAENTRNIRVYKMFISRIQAYKQSNKSIGIE